MHIAFNACKSKYTAIKYIGGSSHNQRMEHMTTAPEELCCFMHNIEFRQPGIFRVVKSVVLSMLSGDVAIAKYHSI